MKWYNKKAYDQHVKDLEFLDIDDDRKKLCLQFVRQVAGAFNLTYPRIGILDINDLIQEGYVAALTSWGNLDWKAIEGAPEDEWQPIVWAYIKIGIKRQLYRSIATNRDTIRIPEHYYVGEKNYTFGKKAYDTDVFLTRTFSSFFDEDYAESIEYQGESYQNEQLNLFLNDVMDEFLDQMTKQIVKMFYGIDEPNDTRKPVKEIMEWARKSQTSILSIKYRGLKKLKQEEVTEQIEKYLLNVAVN